MLTALDSLGDKVSGLDAGADDYIVKPFAMEELLARLRIWSRRSVPLEDPSQLDFGDLCYQPGVRLLKGPEGEEILPKRLAQLMELLLRSAGTPITRSVIFNRIWGAGCRGDGCGDRHLYPFGSAAADTSAFKS